MRAHRRNIASPGLDHRVTLTEVRTHDLRRRVGLSGPSALFAVPLFAATCWWAFATYDAVWGTLDMERAQLLALAGPLVLGLALLLSGPLTRPPLKAAGVAAVAVGAGMGGAVLVEQEPRVVLALPAILISAAACVRHPAAALIGAFVLTGTFNTIEVFTPLPVGATVDLILAGLWAAAAWRYLTVSRDRPVWIWPGVAVATAYVALTLLQSVAGEDLYASLYSFRISVWYFAAALLVGYMGLSERQLLAIARGISVVAVLVGAYALYRWIAGPAGEELAAATQAAGKYNLVNNELRVIGSFPTGPHLAAWTGIVAPFCLGLALTLRDGWRLVAAAGGALCVLGLLASSTRTGLLAAVLAGALVMLLYQLARGFLGPHLGVTAVALACAIGVGITAYSLTVDSEADRQRYANLLAPERDPSVQARITKWSEAWRDIRSHPLGRGMGSSGEAEKRYSRFASISSYELDNSYLHVATQQGVAMLAVFVASLLMLLGGMMRRGLTSPNRQRAGICIGAVGSLVALMVLMVTGLYVEGLPALAAWLIVGVGLAQFTSTEPPARLAG